MIKLLQKSRFFLFILICLNITSLIANEYNNPIFDQSQRTGVIAKLFNEDGDLSFDAIMELLEAIENEELDDDLTYEEWIQINHFIIYLARQGIMPDTTEEEIAELERDIEELLYSLEHDVEFEDASYRLNGYEINPAIYYYDQGNIIHCKSWVKKQCNHTGKFLKNHKKNYYYSICCSCCCCSNYYCCDSFICCSRCSSCF